MCGILAMYSLNGPLKTENFLTGMDTLRKRGPDGQGTWLNPDRTVALGHTRLSIMDLAGGGQPILNENRDICWVVNGELYEHERILAELKAKGHLPQSRSDSEIVGHLYEDLKTQCLEKLRGEFAFVLYDENKKQLFAARDRFGIKPLYYSVHNNILYLASEAKAILAAGVPAVWDEGSVNDSLHLMMRQDQTLFKNIGQLPPGHFFQADKKGIKLQRYWDAQFLNTYRRKVLLPEDYCQQETTQLLEEAVRIRTQADVPIACYLSGGVDSSTVLALTSRFLNQKTAAFTISFDHPEFDEHPQAEEMARFAGVDFHSIKVTDQDFANVFEDVVTASETLAFNTHAPARYILSQKVKEAGYKVVLGGEGADEVFAGYAFLQKALTPKKNIFSAGENLGLITQPVKAEKESFRFSPFLSVLTKVVGISEALKTYIQEKVVTTREMLSPEFIKKFRFTDPYLVFFLQFRLSTLVGRERFRQLLYLWLKSAFVNYVLAGERLDMVNGVELRLPFLDHKLFEFGAKLPASLLYKNSVNKYLLRTIARPYITDTIYKGEKKPFIGPPAIKKDSPLSQLFLDLIHSRDFQDIPFFDHARVIRFADQAAKMNEAERTKHDPLFFMLASFAVLQRNYKLRCN